MRLIVDKRVVSGLITTRGMTYRSLAAAAGTSATSISELANGKRVDTKEPVAKGLADALNVPLGMLFVQVGTSIDLGEIAA
jgi:transcriptional regulator with XRE-family HTH domain